LLLGPKWEQSGPIFALFGPGIGITTLYATHGWIHLSIGRADRWFRWGIIEFAVTTFLFVCGLPWGPVGVAAGWTASLWILTFPALWYACRPIDLPIGAMISAVWRYIIASVLAGVGAGVLLARIPSLGPLDSLVAAERILIASALFGALYLALVILFHWNLDPLYQVGRLVRDTASSRSSKARSIADPIVAGPGGETIP
jgi:O-antigen/teichoic acid export membrane protein